MCSSAQALTPAPVHTASCAQVLKRGAGDSIPRVVSRTMAALVLPTDALFLEQIQQGPPAASHQWVPLTLLLLLLLLLELLLVVVTLLHRTGAWAV